jgi:hypothetical protein
VSWIVVSRPLSSTVCVTALDSTRLQQLCSIVSSLMRLCTVYTYTLSHNCTDVVAAEEERTHFMSDVFIGRESVQKWAGRQSRDGSTDDFTHWRYSLHRHLLWGSSLSLSSWHPISVQRTCTYPNTHTHTLLFILFKYYITIFCSCFCTFSIVGISTNPSSANKSKIQTLQRGSWNCVHDVEDPLEWDCTNGQLGTKRRWK